MTAEAASDESTVASERPRRTWSANRRAAQGRRRRDDATDGARPDVEVIAEEQVAEAVANITTLAGFAMPIAPYTAVTLMGVPGDKPGEWLVQSRAEMAGRVLLEHAKRNRRVLAAIARFNLMFKNVELLEVAGSVVASVAVDAKLVPPDATITLPGGIEAPILYPAIGDTIEYIAGQQGAGTSEGTVKIERQARPTPTTPDVTQPAEPWDDERDDERRAQVAETRRRIAARDAARDANGGVEPTLRREGQVRVEGDVTKT